MLAGKHPFSQPWRNGVAASSEGQLAIPIPLKSQFMFLAQYKDPLSHPKELTAQAEGGMWPTAEEKACDSNTHERKWSHSNPEISVGRKRRESKSEDVKELGRKARQRYFKGGGERHLTNSSSPSGWARRVPWGCRSHCTVCAFGTAVPVSWAGQEQRATTGASHPRAGAERCCLVPLAPKVSSGDPGSVLVEKLQVSVLLEPRDGLRWMELSRNNSFHFSFSATVTKCLQKAAFLKYEGEQLSYVLW